MTPAIAQGFTVDQAVERLRKKMVDAAHILILAPGHVAPAFEFLCKVLRELSPGGSGESDELARDEIAGMRGHDIEEAGLVGRVAEGLDSADMFAGDFHRERMSAVSSC